MSNDNAQPSSVPDRVRRLRREPPRFRRVTVTDTEAVNPRLMRVTLAGDELVGFAVEEPAASVRMLLPARDSGELVMPTWNGNEFLLPDGSRPSIRTFTPSLTTAESRECDLFIVVHDEGAASDWARTARPGWEVALSGPGRGYEIDTGASAYLLGGDESAIPAIIQVLSALPTTIPTQVVIEIAASDARVELPDHPNAQVTWLDLDPDAGHGDALVTAITSADLGPSEQVWVAGEAAAVQRIRRHLFDTAGMPRAQATVRGYWKHGRAGT